MKKTFPPFHSLLTSSLLLAVLTVAGPQTASAGIIRVSNLNDRGSGSLRQAINDNNAVGGGNTIVCDPGLAGTITLTEELVIGTNITITGPGATGFTVSGNNASRVFSVANGTVAISGLTIANGSARKGGGILSEGTLAIRDCAFSGNTGGEGGGIYNKNVITVTACTFRENRADGGGAIYSSAGTLTAINSVFDENVANYGGGIFAHARAAISGSTFSHNSGGGIQVFDTLTLTNSTLTDNGGYGISLEFTEAQIDHCTIVANSGSGINGNSFTIRIANTIIAGNSGVDIEGNVLSLGYNLIGNDAGSSGWGAVGDQVGTSVSPLNAMLGPLRGNGGSTRTMLPLPGSSAIDQGKSSGLSFDQRGRPRPFDSPSTPNGVGGDGSDIGAVEFQPGEHNVLVTNTNNDGPGSLRQGMVDVLSGFIVTFSPSVTGTITLTSGELVMTEGVTLNGPGPQLLTLSGNHAGRIFHITGGASQISNLRIANGYSEAAGGGVAIGGGSLTLSNCVVAGCVADSVFGGGGIYAGPGQLSIIASTIHGNNAPYGGGIGLGSGANASVINSTVSGNRAGSGFFDATGGGIHVQDANSLTITDSTIANNRSATAGGGISRSFGTVAIRNSLIAGNSAPTGPDCNGNFVSNGYNLIGNTGGSSGFGFTGDQLNLNPLMGPLQDNGGPTFTHALLPGSPAIDKGLSFGFVTDQRGGVRPFDKAIGNASGGDGSDIGAFESGGFCRITSVLRAANDIHLSFTTDLGNSYALQWRDNVASGAWATIGSSLLGSGAVLEAADSRPLVTRRFYRIQVADPPTRLVYANNFEGAVGSEWSVPQAVSTTPLGGRKFLGEFASTVVTLQLANLPSHTQLLVSFDLFILKSWDGNRIDFGPDTFQLSVRGGPTLIGSTFSTYTTQSYPGALTDGFPANTGAAEINTLGYTHSVLGPADAVYRLTAAVNHSAPSMTLDFSGVNLQEIGDESWGLDNVSVEALNTP